MPWIIAESSVDQLCLQVRFMPWSDWWYKSPGRDKLKGHLSPAPDVSQCQHPSLCPSQAT
eukprot:10928055-Prorocentrum_lima.AAC.1